MYQSIRTVNIRPCDARKFISFLPGPRVLPIIFFQRSEDLDQVRFFQKLERLRNENKDKRKTQMTQSFNQYFENETKIWPQSILNQFNRVSSSCLRSHFVISLLTKNVQSIFSLFSLNVFKKQLRTA